MKKILYSAITIALVSATLFLDGCKKAASIDGHVQTVTTAGSVNTYSYDSQGRLTTFTNANGSTSIVYSPSSVTITNANGTTVVPLNAQGYAISVGSNAYSYDNSGDLISDVAGTSSTTYSYTNGNVNTVSTNNVTTDSYTYLTTTDYRTYGLNFFGKNGVDANFFPRSHNLTNTDLNGSTTFQYSYTYDSKGRVQTQTVSGGGGTTTSVYTYTTN